MRYDYIAILDVEVPQAVEPIFQHIAATYASEMNKTVSVWRAAPDELLDFMPLKRNHSATGKDPGVVDRWGEVRAFFLTKIVDL